MILSGRDMLIVRKMATRGDHHGNQHGNEHGSVAVTEPREPSLREPLGREFN